jgi:surface polysaccharide O-acyltransferase-like enzyme
LTPQTSSVAGFLAQGGGHLWFLLLVPQFYLLFAVWPRRHRWAIAAAAVALQTALCVIRLYVAFPGWGSQVMLTYAYEIFPFWIGYFAVGVAVGDSMRRPGALRRALNVWRWRLAGLAAVATAGTAPLLLALHFPGAAYGPEWLTGTGAFLNPVLPFFVFALSTVIATSLPPLLRAWRPLARVVSVLSDDSLGIYIVHPILLGLLALYVLKWPMAHGGITSLLAWGAMMLVTLTLSLVAVRLVRATPAASTLGASRAKLPFLGGGVAADSERAA